MNGRRILALGVATGLAGLAGAAQGQDHGAAEALMKKSGCMACHSVSARKDGPSFRETAAKYKGKADAEKALYAHLTTSSTIKIDGVAEKHEPLKTRNDAEIRNVIRYILSR
jgi:cytochrome c